MSEFKKVSKRFSMYIYIQNETENLGIKPVYSFEYKLKNFMDSLVKNYPLQSEDDWVRFFLKILLDANKILEFFKLNINFPITYSLLVLWNLSNSCVICYLQLISYYSAKQIYSSIKNSPNLKTNYPLEELFSIASETTLKPAKLLRKFDFNNSFPVYGYAQQALYRAIQNQIAKDLKTKAIKSTNRTLLRNTSGSQLKKALVSYGIGDREYTGYYLAWQCFVELNDTCNFINKSKNHENQLLNSEQLSLIYSRYNQQLNRINPKQNSLTSPEEIQQMLTMCIQAIRSYQNKQVVYLEDNKHVGESFDITDELIEEYEREKIDRLRDIVKLEFEKSDKTAQISLLLWLGLDFNQGELLGILNLQEQYQVSRKFKTYQKNLLKAVTKTYLQLDCAKELSLTEKQINQICHHSLSSIKDCLNVYAKNIFNGILEDIIHKEIKQDDKKILQNKLEGTIIQKIQLLFTQMIEARLQIPVKQHKNIDFYVAKFVEQWLKQNRAVLFK